MDADATVMRGFDAMGTRFECVLAAFDRPVHRTEAEATAEELGFLVRDWHNRLTVFDPASVLSVVNALAAERPVSVDRELFSLLARCLDYTQDTRGRFDIAVGSLMRSHGFRSGPGQHARPADLEPDAPWGSALVRLDPKACTVRFAQPGIALDLGGIAKGFVLDLAREEMADLGVANALIHGGTSSVIALGAAPTPHGPRPWRVRVMPDDPSSPIVDLVDAALSVSAPSGRAVGGKTHIMDPGTGRPASGVEAACVIGPSAEVCEAWSTALAVDPTLTTRIPAGYRSLIHTPSRQGPSWRSFATPSVPSSALR